jgi:ornithine cyclodeaminase/alanine dehydrogenase-like protein (mu-crystallin family)
VLDSAEITSVRTAAATAVAARHLARTDASVVAVCGCGEQAGHQLRALVCVRRVRHVFACDVSAERAERFAHAMRTELDIPIDAVPGLGHMPSAPDIWVTCTPSRQWFLGRAHVTRGAFVAAVGADNPEKQEIEPELMAESVVVPDVLDQCAALGDLHHALDTGVMRTSDVRGELADIVSGRTPGRQSNDEVIIFDSTGTALQDVAVAALVYERALAAGAGLAIDLGSLPAPNGALALGGVP